MTRGSGPFPPCWVCPGSSSSSCPLRPVKASMGHLQEPLISSPPTSQPEINNEKLLQRHRRECRRRHMHHGLSSSSRGLSAQQPTSFVPSSEQIAFLSVLLSATLYSDINDTFLTCGVESEGKHLGRDLGLWTEVFLNSSYFTLTLDLPRHPPPTLTTKIKQ